MSQLNYSTNVRNRQPSTDLCDHTGRQVATLRGDTLHKSVHGHIHMLRAPRAWAIDECLYRQAVSLGATAIIIHDLDALRDYYATVADFDAFAFRVSRGHGEQIALCLPRWRILSSDRDQDPEPERPAQLRLAFGGAL